MNFQAVDIIKMIAWRHPMNGATLFAFFLLMAVSVGHLLRLIFAIEITIGGGRIPIWMSLPAAILFGLAGLLLARAHRPEIA